MWRKSPDDLEPFIQAEFLIWGYNRDLLGQGLSNDLSVKRIAVVKWQLEQEERMICREGQYAEV